MRRHSSSISNSKPLFRFAFKALTMLLVVVLFCLLIMPQYVGECTASLIDKVDRLMSISGPKIVLIGNSNLTFGIDSELIEQAFGMPVVNMGLHAGLGNAFHEEMARLNVTEGDIYIICHTSYDASNSIADPVLAWVTIEDHPKLWQLLRPCDIWPMLKAFPTYLRRCLNSAIEETGNSLPGGVYSRDSYNEYGDIGVERTTADFNKTTFFPDITDMAVSRINKLNVWLQERGATLLIAAYPIINIEGTAEPDDYRTFQTELADRMDCPVISDYTDYIFDRDLFYDTIIHMTTEGAQLRTKQLISDLQVWFDAGGRR